MFRAIIGAPDSGPGGVRVRSLFFDFLRIPPRA